MGLEATLTAYEPHIRLGVFVAMFAIMAAWEVLAPRRARNLTRQQRWGANLGLAVLNTLLARVTFPLLAVGVSQFATDRGWGLFNAIDAPYIATFVVSLIALDFAIYLQHVLFHAVPALWRLHRVHHADLDFDVTTGVRFHPLEILLSLLIKFAAIAALGAPPSAVILFEVVLNAMSMFNHGNVRLPASADRLLRWLVVTPDMHRVHHSIDRIETDSNFGFNLSIWDRLLGTYRPQPAKGHDGMTIGISQFRNPAHCATLPGVLALPFRHNETTAHTRFELPHESN